MFLGSVCPEMALPGSTECLFTDRRCTDPGKLAACPPKGSRGPEPRTEYKLGGPRERGRTVGVPVGTGAAEGSEIARLSTEFVDDLMLQNEFELI